MAEIQETDLRKAAGFSRSFSEETDLNSQYLHPIRSKVRGRSFVGYDIETLPGEDNKFLCAAVYGFAGSCSRHRPKLIQAQFTDKRQAAIFLRSLKGRRVVATNAQFDLFGTIDPAEFMKDGGKIILRSSNLIFASIDRVSFIDTLNFAKASVKQLGDNVGVPKLEQPEYIKEKRRPTDLEMPSVLRYNMRDAEISQVFMTEFQARINELGGSMKTTIAATALDLFRRKYLKRPLFQQDPDTHPDIRQAYYGGRTEIFKRGLVRDEGNGLFYYDFNSMYPAVMKEPVPDPAYCKLITTDNKFYQRYEGVSECEIIAPDLDIPLLPYRLNGKLVFPVGRFRGWYTHIELREAERLGYKIKAGKTYYYSRTIELFKDYVTDLYEKRQQYTAKGDTITAYACKLLLNSLYGKFAQRPDQQDIVHIDNYVDNGQEFEIVGDFVMTQGTPDKIPVFINPIISAYVTARARIKLYHAFQRCGLDHVFYCDTDSLITDINMVSSKELGELKLERELKSAILVKPKMYIVSDIRFNDVVRVKGLKCRSKTQFYELMDTQKATIEIFNKFRASVRRDLVINAPNLITKKVSLEDDKRVWNTPFSILSCGHSQPIRLTF